MLWYEQHARLFDMQGASQDLVAAAEYLRLASDHLALVTGRVVVDDVLDVLFAKFCIGK